MKINKKMKRNNLNIKRLWLFTWVGLICGLMIFVMPVNAGQWYYTTTQDSRTLTQAYSSSDSLDFTVDHEWNRDAIINYEQTDENITEFDNIYSINNTNRKDGVIDWGTYINPNLDNFGISGDGSIEVLKEFEGRENVINSTYGTTTQYFKYVFSAKNNYIIDWYWLLNTSTFSGMYFNNGLNYGPVVYMSSGDFSYHDGISAVDLSPTIIYNQNEWYHNRIIVNSLNFSYTWIINDTIINENLSFRQIYNDTTSIEFLTFDGIAMIDDLRVSFEGWSPEEYNQSETYIETFTETQIDGSESGWINNDGVDCSSNYIKWLYVNNSVNNEYSYFKNNLYQFDNSNINEFQLKQLFDNSIIGSVWKMSNDTSKPMRIVLYEDDTILGVLQTFNDEISWYNGTTTKILDVEDNLMYHFYWEKYNSNFVKIYINGIEYDIYQTYSTYSYFNKIYHESYSAHNNFFTVSSMSYNGNTSSEAWDAFNGTRSEQTWNSLTIDSVNDYDMNEGVITSKGIEIQSSNHTIIGYNSTINWNINNFAFETIVKLNRSNDLYTLRVLNSTFSEKIKVEVGYNSFGMDCNGTVVQSNLEQINYSIPIYLAVYSNLTNVWAYFNQLDDNNITSITCSGFGLSTNITSKWVFEQEFIQWNNNSALNLAVDSNVYLQYKYNQETTGIIDYNYRFGSIREIYNVHDDSYSTYDVGGFWENSENNFTLGYEMNYVKDTINDSSTYRMREIYCEKLTIPNISLHYSQNKELKATQLWNSEDFTFSIAMELQQYWTVKVEMGSYEWWINGTGGTMKVLDQDSTQISISTTKLFDMSYFTVLVSPDNESELYYGCYIGDNYYYEKLIINNDNLNMPEIKIYNYDLFLPTNNATNNQLMAGVLLYEYDDTFDNVINDYPIMLDINYKGNGTWFTPRGRLSHHQITLETSVPFTIPVLVGYTDYFIKYASCQSVNWTSMVDYDTNEELNFLENDYTEMREATNVSSLQINSSSTEMFDIFQFEDYEIEFTGICNFYNDESGTIQIQLIHDFYWTIFIMEEPPTLLDIAINMFAPFLMMIIFPIAFHKKFGRIGFGIGLVLGFVIFGVAQVLTISQAIILSGISIIILIVIVKTGGGKIQND